jgi:Domain of unknown function (DUF4345)
MLHGTTADRERRLLQVAIVLFACIPISAGFAGAFWGVSIFGDQPRISRDLDSHGRYLSGLLLGIGLTFWSLVPRIERQGPIARGLTVIVIIGGLARLWGAIVLGLPSTVMIGALAMELVVTPLLALWRQRVERRCAQDRA